MINLHVYDIIILNSSGGKDSLCAVWEMCRIAEAQHYPKDKIVVSHQDLGHIEWPGTKELVQKQADFFGLKTYYSKRRDKNGYEENLLEYALRRGKWPSSQQRWCTSDFKRGPGGRVVTALTKGMKSSKVLYVFGFRKDESPARSKKIQYIRNKNLTTKSRTVYDYLPIHDWDSQKVWKVIKDNDLPYHPAYDLGMPRLSCVFCIYSPFDALVVAGRANPHLLNEYIAVEEAIDHTFQIDKPISAVKKAIDEGYAPNRNSISDWVM